MKKLLIIMTVALMSMTSFAQNSIVGTWYAEDAHEGSSSEEGVNVDMSVTAYDEISFSTSTFQRKFSSVMLMDAVKDGKKVPLSLTVKGSMKGTWSLSDGILTITPDKKAKPDLDVETEGFPGVVKAMLVGMMKKEVKDALVSEERYEVLSLSDTELKIKNIPDPKSKNQEAPEETVYKRK